MFFAYEQKKYEMTTQTSVDNAVKMICVIKSSLKILWKKKNNSFIKRNIAFLSWTKIFFILGDILLRFVRI